MQFQKIKDAIEAHNPPQNDNVAKAGKELSLDPPASADDESTKSNST